MITTHGTTPSEKSRKILESLKKTVTKTLERKKKLGQYAVIWDGEKIIKQGEDAPTSED